MRNSMKSCWLFQRKMPRRSFMHSATSKRWLNLPKQNVLGWPRSCSSGFRRLQLSNGSQAEMNTKIKTVLIGFLAVQPLTFPWVRQNSKSLGIFEQRRRQKQRGQPLKPQHRTCDFTRSVCLPAGTLSINSLLRYYSSLYHHSKKVIRVPTAVFIPLDICWPR